MTCYICDEDAWLQRDQSHLLSVLFHDQFEAALKQDLSDLNSIVELLNLFKDAQREVKEGIMDYHQYNCNCCSKCGQHVTYSKAKRAKMKLSSRPHKTDYSWAVRTVLDLKRHQYDVLNMLSNCSREILDIHKMIGMQQIKQEFARVIKYLSSKSSAKAKKELMHIGIYGPPGHGKTHIAQLLSKAFAKSGLLSKPNVFVTARRSDLIGKYCGHTAKNTTAMFDKAQGGVIFIDEIYSLGNEKKDDVFTGECINTINQLLSERTDTLCIIAGYEDDAEKCFFNYNKGLRRRFPFSFKIKPYSSTELVQIFNKQAKEDGWKIEKGALLEADIAADRDTIFDNAGGDMQNLLTKVVMAHYEHNFMKRDQTKQLTRNDVLKGLADYKKHKKPSEKDRPPPAGMYS